MYDNFRQLAYTHLLSLKKQLKDEKDHAVCLHLIVVILFYKNTNCIIHTPGKLVPSVISFLSSQISDDLKSKLWKCQDLINAHRMLSIKFTQNDSGTDFQQPQSTSDSFKCSSMESERVDEVIDTDKSKLILLIEDLKQLL